jgi:hypothetical protein
MACRLQEGQTVNMQMAAVFQGLLSPFFTHAYRTSMCSAEAHSQLCSLLDLWTQRGIYPAAVTEGIKAELLAVVCHPTCS